jgi:hypothetical protein
MNNLSSVAFIILLTVGAAAFMLWLVLRPLLRTVRASAPLRLLWLAVTVLLTLLGLVGLLSGGKTPPPAAPPAGPAGWGGE